MRDGACLSLATLSAKSPTNNMGKVPCDTCEAHVTESLKMLGCLGALGTGRLGQMLKFHLSLFQMQQAASVIIAMLLMIALVDAASFWLRRKMAASIDQRSIVSRNPGQRPSLRNPKYCYHEFVWLRRMSG